MSNYRLMTSAKGALFTASGSVRLTVKPVSMLLSLTSVKMECLPGIARTTRNLLVGRG